MAFGLMGGGILWRGVFQKVAIPLPSQSSKQAKAALFP